MKTLKVLTIAMSSAALLSCNAQEKQTTSDNHHQTETQQAEVKVVTVDEFKSHLTENTQLVDVRTPGEYQSGHIEGADNVDFMGATFASGMEKYDKNEPIYIYCKSGGRSGRASQQLKSMGFMHVYDLQGGVMNWQSSGQELIK